MWRTPNVKRENGAFKVPLTVDEALNMTVADYAVLCSAPREAPAIVPPTLNQKLAVLFAKAEQKVAAAAKNRKNSTKDLELLARYKGQFPPSLLKVMAGEGTAEGVGFHQLAMQIAITASSLGKKEAEVLPLCEGLLQNHVSDGSRYNTPAKRRAELQRMLQYCEGNVCYSYSRDAVRRLVPAGQASTDLDGLSESAGAITAQGSNGNDDGMLSGVFITEAGIYRRAEEGVLECDQNNDRTASHRCAYAPVMGSDVRDVYPGSNGLRRQGACCTSSPGVTSSVSRTVPREGCAK